MRYAPDRAGSRLDLAATVKACPMCLGDLVLVALDTGYYYVCNQCQTRVESGPPPGTVFPALVPAHDALGAPVGPQAHNLLPFVI